MGNSRSDNRVTRFVPTSGRSGLNFVQFKDQDEMGQDRVRYELKTVPAPDVLKRQRGRRQRGSHNGHPYHSDVMENRRPKFDLAIAAAEELEDYEEWLADNAAAVMEAEIVSAPAQLRRARVTHRGDVVVETTEGEVERYKKAA